MADFCPRLIEVALPIREISAESARDKGLPRAHISRLHKWWARRPLAAARAVTFASLVPDPDDERCPADFRLAVERLLKTQVPVELKHYSRGKEVTRDADPYRPYKDTPDTLRNRLLTFVAKWSPEMLAFESGKSDDEPVPKNLLDDRSLVKWETSDPENPQGRAVLSVAQELIKVSYGGRTPVVLDPFAGGGAIPLEAGRLGCQPIANDYNPVAYLILRATCEFPQKYGKPGKRTVAVREFGKTVEREVEVPNVLVHDVEYWANRILGDARKSIGHLYPPGKDGKSVANYLWVRKTTCANPTCKGEIPLVKNQSIGGRSRGQFGLALAPIEEHKTVRVTVSKKAKGGTDAGYVTEGGARCPFCHQVTDLSRIKQSSFEGGFGDMLVAVMTADSSGRDYRSVEEDDLNAFTMSRDLLRTGEVPAEPMPDSPDFVSGRGWNFPTWGSLFSSRQLVAMQTLMDCFHKNYAEMSGRIDDSDYVLAVSICLALWLDRIAVFGNSMCRWRHSKEEIENPFDGQAIHMVFDYPEVNPFSLGSGSPASQLEYLLGVISHERVPLAIATRWSCVTCSSATSLDVKSASCDCVVTDPPYFEMIAYADLSDFFYVWLKRSVGGLLPSLFATPLSPKSDEATALAYRHAGSREAAKTHFETRLTLALTESRRSCNPSGVVTVMFAHQSTDAWTALVNAIFEAGLTVTATYPIETEMKATALALGTASLESSITVVCRPRVVGARIALTKLRKEISDVVREAVHRYFDMYHIKGADLVVTCYGPAVGVFGKYEQVERADGTPVGVPELLEIAKEEALKAIAGEFTGDAMSRLYFVWTNLYGTTEQAWDDARLVAMIGGNSEDAIQVARGQGLFVVNGQRCRLALLADRTNIKHLGDDADAPLIDQLHRALRLWKSEDRAGLVEYLRERELLEHAPFWKLAQALFEVLPHDTDDWKLVNALLSERETLKVEARRGRKPDREGELEL